MGLPKVNIIHVGGKLGRTKPTKDAMTGFLLSGTAVTGGIGLSDPKQIFDLAGMTALGITTSNNPLAVKEITAFYNRVGEGAALWIMLFSNATTLADACLKTNNIAKKLLDAAGGLIRIFGVNKTLPTGYTMSNDECIDADVLQAKLNLQALYADHTTAHKPFVSLLPGLGFDKTKISDLHDCSTDPTFAVGIVLWADEVSGKPAVGHTLGSLAALPVQRNIGRVLNGDIGLLTAYYPDGTPIEELEAEWGNIYDKAYISLRVIYGKSGFYFTDDRTCVANDNDFNSLSKNRTINKAHTIAYDVQSNWINDDIDTDDNGGIPAAMVGSFQSEVERSMRTLMKGEVSAANAYIDPAQDILGTDEMDVVLKVRPKGQLKDIETQLSFDNPFAA